MSFYHRLKSLIVKHPEEEQVLETIEGIMDEREERGDELLVNQDELLLLKNLFRLRDVRANQIMIPRIDIAGIALSATVDELKRLVIRDKFTRMPVYDKTLDNIVGIVHVKDLLCALFNGKDLKIDEIMSTAVLFVPPAIRALDLLREMQAKRAQMAVVIDEFGGTDGLITLEDLLEEIVGEIEDEHDALDEALRLKQINGDLIEADARVYVDDLEDMTGPFLMPADKEAGIDTIGGLVFHHAGRLPHRGESISHPSGIKFQVVDVDDRHIKKVRVSHFKNIHIVQPEETKDKKRKK